MYIQIVNKFSPVTFLCFVCKVLVCTVYCTKLPNYKNIYFEKNIKFTKQKGVLEYWKKDLPDSFESFIHWDTYFTTTQGWTQYAMYVTYKINLRVNYVSN